MQHSSVRSDVATRIVSAIKTITMHRRGHLQSKLKHLFGLICQHQQFDVNPRTETDASLGAADESHSI